MFTPTHYAVSWSVKKTWCPMLVVILWKHLLPLCTTTYSSPTISVSVQLQKDEDVLPRCWVITNTHPCDVGLFLFPPRAVNDGRRASPCAYSYVLFEPEDAVMRQNLQYYRAYGEQWGLQPDHFSPRRVSENLTQRLGPQSVCSVCLLKASNLGLMRLCLNRRL